MLYGIDISNWNTPKTETLREADFMIHKATEGKSYVDRKITTHVSEYTTQRSNAGKNPLLGFYHFGQPSKGNSALAEAEHFLANVKAYIGDAILALDMEEQNRGYVDWALEWLNYVEKKTGVKPMLYTSASNLRLYNIVYEENYGLWVANYKRGGNAYPKVKPETTGPWPFFAIWQWSNGATPPDTLAFPGKWFNDAVDQDVFNGSAEVWTEYATSNYNSEVDNSVRINSYLALAADTVKGVYGDGEKRRAAIEKMGFNYDVLQEIINTAYKSIR